MWHELRRKFVLTSFLLLGFVLLLLSATSVQAQEQLPAAGSDTAKSEVKSAAAIRNQEETGVVMPVFTNYKGIAIGMSADEVRQKLGGLKDKGAEQDHFVFSDTESAEVHYDREGQVRAISINYVGKNSGAPDAVTVLGEEIQTKDDGSMYKLVQYPAAKYWVAYNRTAGDSPIITVTLQKIP